MADAPWLPQNGADDRAAKSNTSKRKRRKHKQGHGEGYNNSLNRSTHIHSEKSNALTDRVRERSRQGTFVTETKTSSELVHPRIDSSHNKVRRINRTKMDSSAFDDQPPLSPVNSGGKVSPKGDPTRNQSQASKDMDQPRSPGIPEMTIPLPETPDFDQVSQIAPEKQVSEAGSNSRAAAASVVSAVDDNFSPKPVSPGDVTSQPAESNRSRPGTSHTQVGKSKENTMVSPKAVPSSDVTSQSADKPLSRPGTSQTQAMQSKENTAVLTAPNAESVHNISPKERNVTVVSGAPSPSVNNSARTPIGGTENATPPTTESPPPQQEAPPTVVQPVLVVAAPSPAESTREQSENHSDGKLDSNALTSEESRQTPPPEVNEPAITTPHDLQQNWDQRRGNGSVSRTNSARTEKSSMPGEPILYKKPAKSAKRPSIYDPQEMLQNASQAKPEDDKSETKPIFGSNWSQSKHEKSLEDDRILKLTDMLNQIEEQLGKSEEEKKRLKEKNRALENQIGQLKDDQSKANTEVQLIKTEWQTLTKELEAKQAENERLRLEQAAKQGEGQEAHLQQLQQELQQVRQEKSTLQTDLQALTTQRHNENQAHQARIQELESLMITKEADVEKVRSEGTQQKTDHENEIKALKEEIERLKIENKALRDEIEKLKVEAAEQNATNTRLSVTLKLEQEERHTVQLELSGLKEQHGKTNEDKIKLQVEMSSLKEKIVLLEQEIEILKNKIQNLNKENQTLLQSLTVSEKDKSELRQVQSKLASVERELEFTTKEKEAAQRTLQEREKALATDFLAQEQLKMALQNSENQNEKLSKEVNSLSEENAALKQQISTKTSDVEKLMLKVVELNERSENNSITLSSMADLVKEKQSHIDDLRKEIHTLKATNSNYYNKIEDISSSRKTEEDVMRAKYHDMEAAHKKLLDENKRLRTLLAHKNMTETNQDSEKDALRDKLYEAEIELKESEDRVQHLEAMMDDVYKAREITGSRNTRPKQFLEEEEDDFESQRGGGGMQSLPDIQTHMRREQEAGRGYPQNTHSGPPGRSTKTSQSGHSWELRNYRYANSYSKRFEKRPNKLKKSGVVTQLR